MNTGVVVRDIKRAEVDGRECWTARVTHMGETFFACDPYGSWERRDSLGQLFSHRSHPVAAVCDALSAKARRLERQAARKERNAA